MTRSRPFLAALVAGCLCLPPAAAAQWNVVPKAALPAVPYWPTIDARREIALIPLIWSNDIDGGGGGCCAVGAASRARLGPSSLWLGLAFGTAPDAGALAGLELAAELESGTVGFRSLHGRSGLAAFYPISVFSDDSSLAGDRLGLGISTVWLYDDRYLATIPFFDCPSAAPAAPCEPVDTPYPWSAGQDNALVAELAWGRGEWRAPYLTASLGGGVKIAGGEHDYLRAELTAEVRGQLRRADWRIRVAGGWSSGDAPLQRRFLLYGADPVTRWLNPYLDVKGALFEDVPYFVPGGPHLRAYEATQPLVKRYIGALAEAGRAAESVSGFWGRLDGFVELAWTPAIPERLGPDAINASGSFIFDWRELPTGEDEAQGRFLARSLRVSEIWADAGVALTGGYRDVAVQISSPFWASEAAFANGPVGDGEKQAFAARWTLSILFYPQGRPGR
jgi:hypothetical protein